MREILDTAKEVATGVIGWLGKIDWPTVLTIVLAVATLLVVLAQERRWRNRANPAIWEAFSGAKYEVPTGEQAFVIQLEQQGSHSVLLDTITFFGSRPRQTEAYRVKSWVFRPGDTTSFLAHSDDVDSAWILISWSSLDDRRIRRTEWIPLVTTGSLQTQRWEAEAKASKRSWLTRLISNRTEQTRRVGPAHSLSRTLPRGRKRTDKVMVQVQETMRAEELEQTGSISRTGTIVVEG